MIAVNLKEEMDFNRAERASWGSGRWPQRFGITALFLLLLLLVLNA